MTAMVRVATARDADALMRLERETCLVALAHVFDPPFPDEEVRERWTEVLDNPLTHTLVAELDEVGIPSEAGDAPELVGYAASSGTELWHFGVHSRFYGTVLAPDLLDAAGEVMAATGPGPLRLWVLEENHRARRFYAKHGWVPSGESCPSEFAPYPRQLRYQLG